MCVDRVGTVPAAGTVIASPAERSPVVAAERGKASGAAATGTALGVGL